MGGPGSGQWYRWGKKDTTAGANALDVRTLYRKGLLRPSWTFTSRWWRGDNEANASNIGGAVLSHDQVLLRYRQRAGGGEWEDVEEKVSLDWTSCTYGGERPWWLCPHCGRRVAVLYGPGRYFLCRHCYGLAYESQQENLASRLLSKAQAIRERLGGHAGMQWPFPEKPRGMHWRTYGRLRAEHDQAEEGYTAALWVWLGKMDAGLDAKRARR